MSVVDSPSLRRFEALEITPSTFHHRGHVEVAFEMLRPAKLRLKPTNMGARS